MKLSGNLTKITVVEDVVEGYAITDFAPVKESAGFTATLNGVAEDGTEIEMGRSGRTPDLAIKALFEAMHEADVTL